MNARFRIGNVYKFTVVSDSCYIDSDPLVYKGYNKEEDKFLFNFKNRKYGQACPRRWIDDGLVTVNSEWETEDEEADSNTL